MITLKSDFYPEFLLKIQRGFLFFVLVILSREGGNLQDAKPNTEIWTRRLPQVRAFSVS